MTFVDTSALYALVDRDDPSHQEAAKIWDGLGPSETLLLTTNYVVLECFALLQRRFGMQAVRRVHDDLLPLLDIEWVEPDDHCAAVDAVLAADRRDLSLVDCTSFHVMRRLEIRRVFAFDDDFERQGFELL